MFITIHTKQRRSFYLLVCQLSGVDLLPFHHAHTLHVCLQVHICGATHTNTHTHNIDFSSYVDILSHKKIYAVAIFHCGLRKFNYFLCCQSLDYIVHRIFLSLIWSDFMNRMFVYKMYHIPRNINRISSSMNVIISESEFLLKVFTHTQNMVRYGMSFGTPDFTPNNRLMPTLPNNHNFPFHSPNANKLNLPSAKKIFFFF